MTRESKTWTQNISQFNSETRGKVPSMTYMSGLVLVLRQRHIPVPRIKTLGHHILRERYHFFTTEDEKTTFIRPKEVSEASFPSYMGYIWSKEVVAYFCFAQFPALVRGPRRYLHIHHMKREPLGKTQKAQSLSPHWSLLLLTDGKAPLADLSIFNKCDLSLMKLWVIGVSSKS